MSKPATLNKITENKGDWLSCPLSACPHQRIRLPQLYWNGGVAEWSIASDSKGNANHLNSLKNTFNLMFGQLLDNFKALGGAFFGEAFN
jgi:hypothetical protein